MCPREVGIRNSSQLTVHRPNQKGCRNPQRTNICHKEHKICLVILTRFLKTILKASIEPISFSDKNRNRDTIFRDGYGFYGAFLAEKIRAKLTVGPAWNTYQMRLSNGQQSNIFTNSPKCKMRWTHNVVIKTLNNHLLESNSSWSDEVS
jgi:hypothetical protein